MSDSVLGGMSDDAWLTAGVSLLSSFLGGVLALGGNWITTKTQLAAARLSHDEERRKEQKALATELLRDIEGYCSQVLPKRRWAELDEARAGIASRAVALLDPLARKKLEEIDTALWYVNWPQPFGKQANPNVVRKAARNVLGAVQRGEPVGELPDVLSAMLDEARSWEERIQSMDSDPLLKEASVEDEAQELGKMMKEMMRQAREAKSKTAPATKKSET